MRLILDTRIAGSLFGGCGRGISVQTMYGLTGITPGYDSPPVRVWSGKSIGGSRKPVIEADMTGLASTAVGARAMGGSRTMNCWLSQYLQAGSTFSFSPGTIRNKMTGR